MWNVLNTTKTYTLLGLVFFIIFVLQDMLSLKMAWLEYLQQQASFKIYSGLLLITYFMTLFIMPYNRHCKRPHIARGIAYRQHQQRGTLAPLFFYIHSTTGGGAYLLLLSTVYFSHFLIGLLHYQRVRLI